MGKLGTNESFINDGKNFYLQHGCLPANIYWEDETGRCGAVSLATIEEFANGSMAAQHNLASAIGRVTALRQPEQHRLVRVFFGTEAWMINKEDSKDVDPNVSFQDHPHSKEVLIFTNVILTAEKGYYDTENFIPESFCVDIVRQGTVVDLGPAIPVASVDPTMLLMFVIGWDTTWMKDNDTSKIVSMLDIIINACGLKSFELNHEGDRKAAVDHLRGYI